MSKIRFYFGDDPMKMYLVMKQTIILLSYLYFLLSNLLFLFRSTQKTLGPCAARVRHGTHAVTSRDRRALIGGGRSRHRRLDQSACYHDTPCIVVLVVITGTWTIIIIPNTR